ncbi:MAG: isoleucine--tRNA ligase [Candidatus Pacearchaeota archaeon]|nr:isoleucine--tRNA ligase [Candidatus Pacearchaeota archaeon]
MYDFKKTEEQVLKFWEAQKIYQKVKEKNRKGKKFYFLQGPPYTSGKLHIGHAWNNCLKDAALRFKRMNGFNVWDRAGYDMHGLPTENAVQKILKLRDKKDILKFGLDKFAKECRSFSMARLKEMDADLWRLGVWMDYENSYKPVDNDFMSNEWFLIKKAYEQNRLYKGKKIMHWCASCETALAKHELEYETVKDKSIFLKFRLKGNKNEYLVIWTTTPWTIPFNLAVMVNPELEYVKAKVDKEVWILAKALANVVITSVFDKKFKIIEELKGAELEGLEYEHPFYESMKEIFDGLKKSHKNVHTVILSEEYVTTDAGSGLVHCSPGSGPEDYEVGQKYGLPPFNTLDEKGNIMEIELFKGFIAKKDDDKIIKMLQDSGSLLAVTEVEHEYPLCWRCHTPVIFRATEQWFLKIEDLVPEMLNANKSVHWIPKWAKDAFDSWTKVLRDNSITRQRYWGTPVPIWQCPKCNRIEVIGSLKELKEKATTKVPEDLHRPFIDSVKIKCKCNSEMARIPDILDVWLDSGTTSWNCLYYPSQEQYFKEWFPADFILEANEQIKLWFSMLLICSMIALKRPCYKSVYVHGMILDWQGMKMSKSLGNIVSPYEVIEKYGVDLFRYYICECRAGENINFSWEELKQKQRNINVLWNIKNYLLELAQFLGKNPAKLKLQPSQLGLEEKYILSRCHSTIRKVTELFDHYQLDETITEIEKLFLELSRVYIQLVREKSSAGSEKEKEAVLYAVYETLLNTIKIFAPIAPFIAEAIYQELKSAFKLEKEAIHLCEWPEVNNKAIDTKLEQEFALALTIIEKALASRSAASIGVRWPLSSLKVKSDKKLKLSKELQEIIARQVNVKKIVFTEGKSLEVELDTKLTPELESEGYAREMTRLIQETRKKAGLKKEQKIALAIETDTELKEHIKKFGKLIKEKVNATEIVLEKPTKKYSFSFGDKIKGKEVRVSFNVLK